MRWCALLSVFALAACGRQAPLHLVEGRPALQVRGADAGLPPPAACALPFAGAPCCDSAGLRVTSATCESEEAVCAQGVLCECLGESAPFHCSDVCGSDAFVEATCTAGGWACPPGLRPTSECPAGTCWGEPGDCCLGPRCENGAWTCESIREPCQ